MLQANNLKVISINFSVFYFIFIFIIRTIFIRFSNEMHFLFQKEQSNDQMVVLQNASLHASGKYKCEVNAEAPNFNSVSAEANMEVIGEWTGVAFN